VTPNVDPRLRAGPHVFVADVEHPDLDEDDDHHLGRVLRLRAGAELTVSDGAGRWRPCRFGPVLEPTGDVELVAAPPPTLTVAAALVKGDRPDWMVQKLTEIGIDRIVVLHTERSVVRWDGDRAARQLVRLRKVAREAAMQSRRCWLPAVDGPWPVAEVAGLPGAAPAEPGGALLTLATPTVLIGPEGGWSPDELSRMAPGVGIGPSILRTETAALAAAVLLVAARSQ